MANINAGQERKFENGGAIIIGADNVLKVREGTVRWTWGGRQPMPQMDRGVLGNVLEGNDYRGTLEFSIKYTGGITASEVVGLFLGAGTAGITKQQNVKVRIADHRGATTGEEFTFDNCFLAEGGLDYQAASGLEVDFLTLRLTFNTTGPTYAEYGA